MFGTVAYLQRTAVEALIILCLGLAVIASCKPALAQELPEFAPSNETTVISVTVTKSIPTHNLAYVNVIAKDTIKHFDIMVFTSWRGELTFVGVEETKKRGVFVFTGPPGKYNIRVSAFDPDNGFQVAIAQMEFTGTTTGPTEPIKPTEPTVPPKPVEPANPGTGPPVEGRFGFGPFTYHTLIKQRPSVETANKLLDIFKWGVSSSLTLPQTQAEIKSRMSADASLEPFYKAWREEVIRLSNDQTLLPDLDEHKDVYKETVMGIEAAYGK